MEKIIEELVKNPWDFVVYKTNKGFVINVVFHASAIDYSRSFRLDEQKAYQGIEGLKQLSQSIRENYNFYKDREIIIEVE